MTFVHALFRTLLRHPRTALEALWWQISGKKLRARNLLLFDPDSRPPGARAASRLLSAANLDMIPRLDTLFVPGEAISVWCWRQGNFFFTDIAAYCTEFLNAAGYSARLRDEGDPSGDDAILIIAPHEFCIHGPGAGWPPEALARAVFLNTEQWQTSWFGMARRFMRGSGKALDINPVSAAGLCGLGISCGFLPLLPLTGGRFSTPTGALSPSVSRSRHVATLDYPEDFAQRPYALTFMGVANHRRSRALAALAPALADHACFLHMPSADAPLRPGEPDMIAGDDFARIARHSRILLNIHRGESPYFEWHRLFLSGIMQGCVVITEPCLPVGLARAGEHHLEATIAEMPGLIAQLLNTPEGAARMAQIHANTCALRQDLLRAAQSRDGLLALTQPANWRPLSPAQPMNAAG